MHPMCVHMLNESVGRAHSPNAYFMGNYLQLPCPPMETQVFLKMVLALWGCKLSAFAASLSLLECKADCGNPRGIV